jgi:hypothetical protein
MLSQRLPGGAEETLETPHGSLWGRIWMWDPPLAPDNEWRMITTITRHGSPNIFSVTRNQELTVHRGHSVHPTEEKDANLYSHFTNALLIPLYQLAQEETSRVCVTSWQLNCETFKTPYEYSKNLAGTHTHTHTRLAIHVSVQQFDAT